MYVQLKTSLSLHLLVLQHKTSTPSLANILSELNGAKLKPLTVTHSLSIPDASLSFASVVEPLLRHTELSKLLTTARSIYTAGRRALPEYYDTHECRQTVEVDKNADKRGGHHKRLELHP